MYFLYDNMRIRIGRIINIEEKIYVYDENGILIFILEKGEDLEGVFVGKG